MKNIYPTAITASSPNETDKTEIQNGSPSNHQSSNPTIKPLNKTGMNAAKARCLENIIIVPAIIVAIVPNNRSQAENENKLAMKHPIVTPIIESFLKKQSSINNSATLNCKAKYEMLYVAKVRTTYKAASIPL